MCSYCSFLPESIIFNQIDMKVESEPSKTTFFACKYCDNFMKFSIEKYISLSIYSKRNKEKKGFTALTVGTHYIYNNQAKHMRRNH